MLISLEQATQSLIDAGNCVLGDEVVPLHESLGRVLAQDFTARMDVPPVDNSAMDGYAVRAADAGKTLPEGLRIAAGEAELELAERQVARIFTGAPIPSGADAVVMQEDVEAGEPGVALPSEILVGQHIRRRAQDCAMGDTLLHQGRRLLPQDLGLVASQGESQLTVKSKLRVAVLSTGNELFEPGDGSPLPSGAIYNSNRPMLCAMLESLGCDVLDLGIVKDTMEDTVTALSRGAQEADVVLSSGGVSVGEADFVRDGVAKLGQIDLWRVAIKPGKPFAFGSVSGKPYLGLPGNPASSFVTFALLARPFLCRLQGRSNVQPRAVAARAGFDCRPSKRTEFLRVNLEMNSLGLTAHPFPNQSSGILSSISRSDALAKIPAGATIKSGETIELILLESLLG